MRSIKNWAILASGLLIVVGAMAWIYQYREGLMVTNMRNSYSWGLYVSGLAFFVGNAAGGLVLTSLIYVFGLTHLKPFAKIGALTAFANVTAAMLSILPDIGQPIRLYNLLLHPQLASPLIWDIVILNLYAVLSLLYLYLLILPDLKGRLGRLALKVDDPAAFSEKWVKRLAPFSLVAAVGIHVITAWIFATQGARDWWNSAALAPDFLAAALASGTAVVLLVSLFAYGVKEKHARAYRTMGIFISVSLFIHFFLMYNDFFIHAWYGASEALSTLSVTLKDYGAAHAFETAAPLLAVLLFLSAKTRQRAWALASGCLLVLSGVFVHRFLLMPAAFDRIPLSFEPLGLQHTDWAMPIASGRYGEGLDVFVTKWHYFPSAIEWAVFLGVLAYVSILLLIAVDRLPILSREGS